MKYAPFLKIASNPQRLKDYCKTIKIDPIKLHNKFK